jgi:hypothetical protein
MWLERLARSRTFWLVGVWMGVLSGLVLFGLAAFWWNQEPRWLSFLYLFVGLLSLLSAAQQYRKVDKIIGTTNAQD